MRGYVNQTNGQAQNQNTGYQGFGNTANFGQAAAGGQAALWNQRGNPVDQYVRPVPGTRQLTIDDVVTKTAITLGLLIVAACASFFLSNNNPALAGPIALGSGIIALILVCVASFGKKQDNPAIVLSYAVFEGLFVGAISFAITYNVSGSAGGMIIQAVLGTLGVFIGMLVVYRTGAIRVTPKFTRMLVAGICGVAVLALGNFVASFFIEGGLGLRDGGPLAIGFSLLCIGLAAASFLVDFDSADQLIHAGAPEKAAWGIALGLTVTLVWLYLEILRLLSYFRD